jgi:hypothetical protein
MTLLLMEKKLIDDVFHKYRTKEPRLHNRVQCQHMEL